MLFRSLEIILLQRNMLFHSLEIISRERNNIFRSNEMISREQNNIFRCPLRGSVPKPESSRNCVGLVKAHASLARQSEPPPMPSPNMHCPFATWQLNHSLEKRCGGIVKNFTYYSYSLVLKKVFGTDCSHATQILG